MSRICKQPHITSVCGVKVIETVVPLPLYHAAEYCEAELPLINSELFIRDNYTCLYCGSRQTPNGLMRDYIRPLSQSGKDKWSNVATACLSCGDEKAGRTLFEVKMTLNAIPYAPCMAESRILSRRNVISKSEKKVGLSGPKFYEHQHQAQTKQRGKYYAEA